MNQHFSRMANYALVRRRLMSAPVPVQEDLGPKVVVRRRDNDFAQRRYAIEAERQRPLKAQFENAAKVTGQAWRAVLTEVAKTHSVSVESIVGRSRELRHVLARREVAYRMSIETRLSSYQIADRLGGRVHSVILGMVKAYARSNNLPLPSKRSGAPRKSNGGGPDA